MTNRTVSLLAKLRQVMKMRKSMFTESQIMAALRPFHQR